MDAVWLNHKSTGLLRRSVLYIQAELPKSIVFNMWGELIFATDWHGACLSSRDALPVQSVVPVQRNLRIGPLGRYLHFDYSSNTIARVIGELKLMSALWSVMQMGGCGRWGRSQRNPLSGESPVGGTVILVYRYAIIGFCCHRCQTSKIQWLSVLEIEAFCFFISWWQITLNTSRCEMRDELCLCLTGQPMYHDSFIWCSLITK